MSLNNVAPVQERDPIVERDPCYPSPCGPFSQCRNANGAPACSCLATYIGSPPNCKPECTISQDCISSQACIRQKCVDPCPGSCGFNAQCHVINHTPICTCFDNYIGDPFTSCQPAPPPRKKVVYLTPTLELTHSDQCLEADPVLEDPCNPSPCGSNAQCRDGVCTCLAEYHGDPYSSCRPECVLNSDCPRDKACFNSKCADPCPGVCASNAICEVFNHIPMCSCQNGMEGNAFVQCQRPQRMLTSTVVPVRYPPNTRYPPVELDNPNPCHPSPCGPNSQCRQINGQAVCSCVPGYIGLPPTCRPECVQNNECPLSEACSNMKCRNPCIGICGTGAQCDVINHRPICRCPARFEGDPFTHCRPIGKTAFSI